MYELDQRDIHTYFGLSYSNYLVLHRTLLQSMPTDWQHRFVALLDELTRAFEHVDQPEYYRVQASYVRSVEDMTAAERALTGYDKHIFADEDYGPELAGVVFCDPQGFEVDNPDVHRVAIPTGDPVPHYDRGRAVIQPAGYAE